MGSVNIVAEPTALAPGGACSSSEDLKIYSEIVYKVSKAYRYTLYSNNVLVFC
jgi:hypothetical protein